MVEQYRYDEGTKSPKGFLSNILHALIYTGKLTAGGPQNDGPWKR